MTSWFEYAQNILNQYHVTQKTACPRQFCFSEPRNILNVLPPTSRAALVFTDGVPKKAMETFSVDNHFLKILNEASYTSQWVDVSKFVGAPHGSLSASHQYVEPLRNLIHNSSAELVFVLGSGTITDLIKHAMHEDNSGKILVSVPTAISVTAYTSTFAVLDFNGAKRTKTSRCPNFVLWISSYVSNAPHRMTQAGFGDLLAPFLAYGDWALANALEMAPTYSDASFHLLKPFFNGIQNSAQAVGQNSLSPDIIECLCAALGIAGIGMSLAGETAPFSGGEHAVSHGLDFLRTISGRRHVLHGEQVALACVPVATIFDWFLQTPKPDVRKWRTETPLQHAEILKRTFASAPIWGESLFSMTNLEFSNRCEQIEYALFVAQKEFSEDYLKKAEKWASLHPFRKTLANQWPDIQKIVRSLVLSEREIEFLLKLANLPLSPENTEPRTSPMELRWALRFAPFVRSRTSVLDLAFWMGEDPAIIAGI